MFLNGDCDVDVVLFCCICSFHVFRSFVFSQVTVFSNVFYGSVEDFMFCCLYVFFLVCPLFFICLLAAFSLYFLLD